MEYDFECSLRNSVQRYKALAEECGAVVRALGRKTPYRKEPDHEFRQPAKQGPCMTCPWCKVPSAPEDFKKYTNIQELERELRENKKVIREQVEQIKEAAEKLAQQQGKNSGRQRSEHSGSTGDHKSGKVSKAVKKS